MNYFLHFSAYSGLQDPTYAEYPFTNSEEFKEDAEGPPVLEGVISKEEVEEIINRTGSKTSKDSGIEDSFSSNEDRNDNNTDLGAKTKRIYAEGSPEHSCMCPMQQQGVKGGESRRVMVVHPSSVWNSISYPVSSGWAYPLLSYRVA